jgi:hypothetical protein
MLSSELFLELEVSISPNVSANADAYPVLGEMSATSSRRLIRSESSASK